MKIAHIIFGAGCVGLIGAAALWGGWCWRRADNHRAFWWLLRAGQLALLTEVILGGIQELGAHKASGLHIIYGLVPIAVSFVAEQLRIASAEMVLASRGFETAQDVGQLEPREQRLVMLSIIQRELGVMVLAAGVMTVILVRAMMTGG